MVNSVSPSGRSDLLAQVSGRTGALAALLVLFLDLLWRAVAAPTGVVSIPETVVAAVALLYIFPGIVTWLPQQMAAR